MNTTIHLSSDWIACCELLWIMYLWNIEYNEDNIDYINVFVVNCFELCIFEILNTTRFRYQGIQCGCELLWIMYLWNIEYNSFAWTRIGSDVVNCFELCIFEILNTTLFNHNDFEYCCELLWIMYLWNIEYNSSPVAVGNAVVVNCFELCIFEILNTTYQRENNDVRSCELLWIMYLWNIEYNTQKPRMFCCAVVNCFELCIFEILNTTHC